MHREIPSAEFVYANALAASHRSQKASLERDVRALTHVAL